MEKVDSICSNTIHVELIMKMIEWTSPCVTLLWIIPSLDTTNYSMTVTVVGLQIGSSRSYFLRTLPHRHTSPSLGWGPFRAPIQGDGLVCL